MTGLEIQAKLDAIVSDLQTTDKGKQTEIAFRGDDAALTIRPLSSDVNGVVDPFKLAAIQGVLNGLKPLADTYTSEYAPVQVASEAFRLQRATHQVAIDAASAARVALNTELEADNLYQDLKSDYDDANADAGYIAAREAYKNFNVSENYGNLSDGRGRYF